MMPAKIKFFGYLGISVIGSTPQDFPETHKEIDKSQDHKVYNCRDEKNNPIPFVDWLRQPDAYPRTVHQ